MKSLLLPILLLGLVAVLKAQEAPPDNQDDLSGTWYTKATVADRNLTNNIPKRTFPMSVRVLEGGSLDVWIMYWSPGICESMIVHLEKTNEPLKYTAWRNPEKNPEAMEEFKKFAKSKGFRLEYIIVPELL
ncbi:odorant-binding protein 2a-like, partial [Mus pahari]|uniref:odorant-binding protein 2a-like n=1 Tax=Mus pahari TaxID=10093 RepID=UPI000A30A77B